MNYQEIIGYSILFVLLIVFVFRNPTEQEKEEMTNRYR